VPDPVLLHAHAFATQSLLGAVQVAREIEDERDDQKFGWENESPQRQKENGRIHSEEHGPVELVRHPRKRLSPVPAAQAQGVTMAGRRGEMRHGGWVATNPRKTAPLSNSQKVEMAEATMTVVAIIMVEGCSRVGMNSIVDNGREVLRRRCFELKN